MWFIFPQSVTMFHVFENANLNIKNNNRKKAIRNQKKTTQYTKKIICGISRVWWCVCDCISLSCFKYKIHGHWSLRRITIHLVFV